jgi:hypothetical protein
MFNPANFLKPALFTTTPAACMVLRLLEDGKVEYNLQGKLQANHMGIIRQRVPHMNPAIYYVIETDASYSLRVVDSILPDDFQRRTVICMDTEVEDVRHRMFIASGLIPNQKREE